MQAQEQVNSLETGAGSRDRCRAQSQVNIPEPGSGPRARGKTQSQIQTPEPVHCMTATTKMLWDRRDFIGCSEAKNHTAESRMKPVRLGIGEVEHPAFPGAKTRE